MKAAENRPRAELTVPLDRSAVRRNLVHEQIRSEFVVVAGIGRKDLAQMALAQTLPLEPFESISYCHRPNGGRDKALIYWVMAEDWDLGANALCLDVRSATGYCAGDTLCTSTPLPRPHRRRDGASRAASGTGTTAPNNTGDRAV